MTACDMTCSPGVREVVPAARTVLVRFDPLLTDCGALSAAVRGLTDADVSVERAAKNVTVPVVYDGEDLQSVADLLGVSAQEIVARHAGHAWRAAFGGFAPGFTYLTGGDPIFDVPRRADPRLEVPAGAVGLAGTFSGVYPRQSSGGWQLIGTTDTPMWDEHRTPPALIQPGDIVHFTPVRDSIRSVEAPPPDHEASSPRHGINGIRVDDPGMFSVFEDDGRHAATMGVTGSGASDPQAFHLANALVGNPAGTPAIETTGGGLRLTALGDVVLAVTGAPIGIVIHGTDGSRTAIGSQEPFLLAAGEQVTLGIPDHGWRDYIAMQGGFHVDRVLDSASADTLSSIGPKALQRGDTLASAHLPFASVGQPQPWPDDLPASGDLVELDVTLGPRDDWFTAQGVADLLGEEWTVTMQSNRVGRDCTATVRWNAASSGETRQRRHGARRDRDPGERPAGPVHARPARHRRIPGHRRAHRTRPRARRPTPARRTHTIPRIPQGLQGAVNMERVLIANRGEIAGAHHPRLPRQRDARPSPSTPTPTRMRCSSGSPTRHTRCPAPRRRRPISTSTRSSPSPEKRTPTPSTPATGSSPRTPTSPRPCSTPDSSGLGQARTPSASSATRSRRGRIAAEVGAPMAPGTIVPVHDPKEVVRFAKEHGLPIAIKAVHGGGGRGLKVVRRLEDVEEAFESATREAEVAFGNGDCFLERFLDRPRHVEVQILADTHGDVKAIGTRDCSLQRRNQKLIEEAPAPFLSDAITEHLKRTAVAICRKAGYVGAGTVEFLVADDGTMSFMEVNTRIQVEHPVTEMTTGIDLVAEQLRIADGGSIADLEPQLHGHAIEFRINAEDPAHGFVPFPGHIDDLHVPSGPGIRFDTGIAVGTDIPDQFDSMLAKLVVYAPDRDACLRRARRALAELRIVGVPTVIPFDKAVLADPDFASPDHLGVYTRWIEESFLPRIDPSTLTGDGALHRGGDGRPMTPHVDRT